jgi:DDE superfamily endonuclease
MEQSTPTAASCSSPLPASLLSRLAGLPEFFTRPTWQNVLLLVAGAILAPGKRTVTAALRILGREQEDDWPIYHGVLNRAVWSSRAVAGWLLRRLVNAFVAADATVVIGIDDTIERRWGRKISARGIYRDPVRSSKGHFVKTSGLRWLSVQLLVHVPWAGRIMGLPFLTVLAPSKRFYADKPRTPKTLLDCARQIAWQVHRWLPGRKIVLVGDTAFSAIHFLAAVRNCVSVVTRLRLDANLYAPAPPRKPGKRGRSAVKGDRLPSLTQMLKHPATVWQRHTVVLWYGRTNRLVEYATGTAIWYHAGSPPVPIRWLLVRDPTGDIPPQAFLSTDVDADPVSILQHFVSRWQLEVTFQETRAHLGVETQRQWSDLAIMRTTPALLGLFSLITLWANDLAAEIPMLPKAAAWYPKIHCTFSDAIAAVRRVIWDHQIKCMSRSRRDNIKIPRELWNRVADTLAYAA